MHEFALALETRALARRTVLSVSVVDGVSDARGIRGFVRGQDSQLTELIGLGL